MCLKRPSTTGPCSGTFPVLGPAAAVPPNPSDAGTDSKPPPQVAYVAFSLALQQGFARRGARTSESWCSTREEEPG